MSIKFLSEEEAYKVALNMEEEGIQFYSKCVDLVNDITTKHIFERLLEDERRHYDTFKDLHDNLGNLALKPLGVDEEVRKYLANLIKPGIFYDVKDIPKETIQNLKDEEAVYIGIQVEKDSILFYTEAWQNSQFVKGKKAFKKIMHEEQKHLNILIERLITIRKLKNQN